MVDQAKLLIVLEAQSRKMQNQLVATNRVIDRFAANTERRFDAMARRNAASFDRLSMQMRNSLSGVQGILAPIAASLSVREVGRYADAWISAGNKIAAAEQVGGLMARSLNEIKDAANETRSSLTEYVDLYARLLRASQMVGASEAEVAIVTDAVAKSLKAGGASAQEQAAALIQLGQALSSGFLQGDELRSIRENAPLVARAIAEEFGVTIGELKELGAEGELTSDRVFTALLNGAEEIDEAFQTTQATIHDAFVRIENEFIAYIGNADDANGATQGLIGALRHLADNFKEIADVVLQFAAVLIGALTGRAIAGLVVGLGQAVVALGSFLTAIRMGTLAAGGLVAALGPIGILAGAAAAAIISFNWSMEQSARIAEIHNQELADNATKLEIARDSSEDYRSSLQRQILMQKMAASAALEEAQAQLEVAQARAAAAGLFGDIMNAAAGMFGMEGDADRPDEYRNSILGQAEQRIRDATARLAALQMQMEEVNKIMDTPAGERDGSGGGGGRSSGSDDEFQKEIERLQKRTEMLRAETAAQSALNPLVNDYGYALEKARAAQELLFAAQEAGLAITPELRSTIDALAESYAIASVEAEKLSEAQKMAQESMEEWFSVGRDAARGFIDDLRQGKTAAEAFGNSVNKLTDKLLDMSLSAIFGSGGGNFGLLGSLFGLGGGVGGGSIPLLAAKGHAFSGGNVTPFAKGGVVSGPTMFPFSKGTGLMGEAGPEAIMPLMRGPNGKLGVSAQGAGVSTVRIELGDGLRASLMQESGQQTVQIINSRVPRMIKLGAPSASASAQRNRRAG